MMTETDAQNLLDGLVSPEQRAELTGRGEDSESSNWVVVDMLVSVLAAQDRLATDGELAPSEAAAIKLVLTRLGFELESVERDLLRHLKYEQGQTWEEVAAEFGDAYGGRAAVFNRWKRLTNSGRRVSTRDMRRGAAIRRRTASGEPLGTSDTSEAPTEVDPNQTDLLTSVDQ